MTKYKITAQLSRQGGYFCVLLLSLPIEYPIPKQVKPKLNTAISPKISIWFSPPFPDSLSGFYVNGGSQSLRRGLTAYHPGNTHMCSLSQSFVFFNIFRQIGGITKSWKYWKPTTATESQVMKNTTRLPQTDGYISTSNYP